MLTLYFLRHGQTDFNKQGIVQGSGIDSELNEEGKAQAEAFFHAYQEIQFEAVYGSLLRRTHQTLAPWTQRKGYQMHQHAGLNELNWGVHEGQKPNPLHRDRFRATLKAWEEGELHARVERGESPIEAWGRAEHLFHRLKADYAQHHILLCSHGRQLRVILAGLVDKDLSRMGKYDHDNTGLSIVHLDRNGSARIEKINDTSHL